jgi:hopanoid biosynthesis associated protein HpnK
MPESTKKLTITADDFGYSSTVNQAIIQAHIEGVLTHTSLMVTGKACQEAVQLAKEHPSLAVGIHLVLIHEQSILPYSEIPLLVNAEQSLSTSPFLSGTKAFFSKEVQSQWKKEIQAQFQAFYATGLDCSHIDSHWHIHMNPALLDIILETASAYPVRMIRIPNDDLKVELQYSPQHRFQKQFYHWIFSKLAKRARRKCTESGFNYADKVYGLYQTDAMAFNYLKLLLENIPPGNHEIYFHPDYKKTDKGLIPNTDLQTLLSLKTLL